MSANRLDMVDTFDQFGHDHWKALGTKLGGVETVKALLRGTSTVTIEVIRRLTALTSVTVETDNVNLRDFFKTREGLWVSSNFDDLILKGVSKKNHSAKETVIGRADLAQAANDAEIGAELPEGYVFEGVVTFLVHLATLIKEQWGGKDGVLLNNGYANSFYVKVNGEVFVVLVRWHADAREWYCYAGRLYDCRWVAGYRAFSATATLA